MADDEVKSLGTPEVQPTLAAACNQAPKRECQRLNPAGSGTLALQWVNKNPKRSLSLRRGPEVTFRVRAVTVVHYAR